MINRRGSRHPTPILLTRQELDTAPPPHDIKYYTDLLKGFHRPTKEFVIDEQDKPD